jgi:hypothetical protein
MPASLLPETSLADLTAEVLRLKGEGVGSVERVVLFGSGMHHEGMAAYSRDDIGDILRNFQALSTGPSARLPVVIGLDHVRAWHGAAAGPAVGLVSRLFSEPGGVLAATFADLPDLWARAVRAGLWTRVSAEIDPSPPFSLPGRGCCLTGVTLLGRQRPALKWTSDLRAAVAFAELYKQSPPPRVFRAVPVSGRPGHARVFSEAAMDRDAIIARIIEKFPERERAALEAMTDAQLTELDAAKPPTPQPAPTPAPTPTPAPAPNPPNPNPSPTPVPTPAPTPPAAVTAATFAEFQNRIGAFETRQRELEAEQSRRLFAERSRTVEALFDRWENRRDGNGRPDPVVTPDEAAKDAKLPNLRNRLLAASATRTFGESGLSEFDAMVAEVDRRPPGIFGRFFAEKLRQPGAGAEPPEVVAAKAWAKRKNEQMARS